MVCYGDLVWGRSITHWSKETIFGKNKVTSIWQAALFIFEKDPNRPVVNVRAIDSKPALQASF